MDRLQYEEAVLSILRGGEGWDDSYDEISKFKEYLVHEGLNWGWVLYETERYSYYTWTVEAQDKIIKLLKHLASEEYLSTGHHYMMQFWGVVKVEGKHHHLSSSHLPFLVGYFLKKGQCWYRKQSRDDMYVVNVEADGGDEEQLGGVVGRVYRNKRPESSPDLRLYSAHEFPMRDKAAACGFKGYVAFPVFDSNTNQCYGVLELLSNCFSMLETDLLSELDRGLQIADLRSTHNFTTKRLYQIIYGKEEALNEIIAALQLCEDIPQFHMANVWVPNEECVISTNTSCMKLALSTHYDGHFTPTDRVDWIHVQTGKETVLGMVLASENKSCFCHYEVSNRCEDYFAICLQSSLPEDGLLYVVEFFLFPGPPTYQYILSFLNFLLPIIQHEFKSFKLACGKQLGEELVVEVIEFSDSSKLDSPESEQAHVFPIKFKSVQYEHQHTQEQHTQEYSVAALDSKSREKGKRKSGISLTYEVLEPHFGKPLKDVEKDLGVGRSTIKRACREYGIGRWPNRKEHEKNLPLFQEQSGGDSQQDASNESTHPVIVVEEEKEKVMIKVKYKEDTIKFELCLSLGVSKLFEEVATRLKLKVDTFKLKYVDEDNDEILLTCDADLQLCPKSQTATGKTCIHFFVQLISK